MPQPSSPHPSRFSAASTQSKPRPLSWLSTLYGKLSVSLLVLLTLLGLVLLWVAQYTSDMYSQEVTQRLNGSIAMYVTAADQLIVDGEVNLAAMDELANRAMTINPTVEVYLLDPRGRILTHVLPPESVKLDQVDMAPINRFLSASQPLPILGDDPRSNRIEKVFSVSAVIDNGEVAGYLYAVLGGEKYDSVRRAVEESYILQLGGVAIIGSLLIVVLAALAIFFFLTRRLANLKAQVEQFQAADPGSEVAINVRAEVRDEVDELGNAFHDMAQHIGQQFTALQSLDATRRELIANVSHDLRTPLASMQGYIETLLIKDEELSPQTRREYLEVAYKHSQRLNSLIAELFELAKLDSGAVEVNAEKFSLLELVHDCVQEFGLMAGQREISLQIETDLDNCHVYADIALIQRVLQNLIDNALRHTPAHQSVVIRVANHEDCAVIEVSDTGSGIARHEIPHIFERFYQSQQLESSHKIGAGLGLAIVKRILDLHQSTIAVTSELNQGTSFTFELELVGSV